MSEQNLISGTSEREYSVLLLKLNALIAQGKGDDDEADAVRDKMDVYWGRMSLQQQQRMRWLTVDLEDLSPERPLADRRLAEASWRDEVNREWSNLWRGRVDNALALLRDPRAASLHKGGMLFLKGRAWEAAGLPEIALQFLLAAEAVNPFYSGLVVDLARRLGDWETATRKANNLLIDSSTEPAGIFFACLALIENVRNEPARVAAPVLERVQRRLREVLQRLPHILALNKEMYGGVAVVLGSALNQLGRFSEAVHVYTQFLELNPTEGDFYSLRADTKSRGGLSGAREDYVLAVNNGTKWGWAYAAVAASHLEQGQPSRALAICNLALRQDLEPVESVAFLYQCRAAAQAYLQQSRERVADDYRQANRLMPRDQKVRDMLLRVEATSAEELRDIIHSDEPRLRSAVRAADSNHLLKIVAERVESSTGRMLLKA